MQQPIIGTTDRISDFPPEIIHGILSRLNWSEAARTCVLSKTWYHRFWRSYPVVEYHDHHSNDSDSDDKRKQSERFRSFTVSSRKRLLSYHIPNRTALTALRISSSDDYHLLRQFMGFVSSFSAFCGSPLEIAIETEVGCLPPSRHYKRTQFLNLRVHFCGGENLEEICDANLPNLKSLKIERSLFMMPPELLQLTDAPSLESLEFDYAGLRIASPHSAPYLKTVRISNYLETETHWCLVEELIRNLPSLECLSLQDYMFASGSSRSRWLRISSPKLRELRLTDCWWRDEYSWNVSKDIEIDAPNLELFHYTYENVCQVETTGFKMVEVGRNFRFVAVVRKWKPQEEDEDHDHDGVELWNDGLVQFVESQFRNLDLKVHQVECLGKEDLQLVISQKYNIYIQPRL